MTDSPTEIQLVSFNEVFARLYHTLPQHLKDCQKWPKVAPDDIPDTDKERFDRLARGVRQFLQSGNVAAAAREAGTGRKNMHRLLLRCLEPHPLGGIYGWTALLKGVRQKVYERTAPEGGQNGFSGSFDRLLTQHPTLKQDLDAFILPTKNDGELRVVRPSLDRVFHRFKLLCKQEGLTDAEYPFNTKSKARKSVERYAKALRDANPEVAVGYWYGDAAQKRLHLGRGKKGFEFARKPFDVGMLDAHKIDCQGTVIIPGPAGPQAVRINRIWIYVLQDVGSRAIASYAASIRVEPDSIAAEKAFTQAETEWVPREFTIEGLEYARGAGLPFGAVPGLPGCRFCIVRLDNAAAHYSHRIIEGVRRRLGCAVTFGQIAGWWRNSILERFFKTLEMYGFQRLASSTGNAPTDPLRPADPVGEAIKHGITWEHLLEVLEVLIANYNATPTAPLGHRSPLEVIDQNVNGHAQFMLPRIAPPVSHLQPGPGITVERRLVRGSLKKGRRPYVEIEKDEYRGDHLATRFDLIDHPVIVHINEHDMRSCELFTEDGISLGIVEASSSFRLTPHTREQKKMINALKNTGVLRVEYGCDAVAALHGHLVRTAAEQAAESPRKGTRAATRAAQSASETGLPTSNVAPSVRKQTVSPLPRAPKPHGARQVRWDLN